MIAIDANILLYAYNAAAPEHDRARTWIEATFGSSPRVTLPLVSILAFVRIMSDRRLSETALSIERAVAIVESWLQRENVSVLVPGPRHWPLFFDALVDARATGPRVTDAHLATLAIEHGATFYTNDRDFRIFTKLDVRFPLLDV